MRFDRTGQSELMECDKNSIIKRASIPARDLRILGSIFSHSSSILEFVRAIITAEELLLLEPLRQEVLPFVDQLRHQLPQKSALEVVCMYFNYSVAELEKDAYPVLDEFAMSCASENGLASKKLKHPVQHDWCISVLCGKTVYNLFSRKLCSFTSLAAFAMISNTPSSMAAFETIITAIPLDSPMTLRNPTSSSLGSLAVSSIDDEPIFYLSVLSGS
nr:magnesium transporter MRS2-4 [Ipomoea batatas]